MDSLPYPRRIVCLQPSATAILASIGELHRVVACTKYCVDVVPELQASLQHGDATDQTKRIIVADSWTSKSAEILAARPDLVIAAVPYQEAAVIEILKAGRRFLGLAPRSLEDIYADIALISGAVGASAQGERVIKEMRDAIESVRNRTATLPRRRVFCEEWGKPIIASQPWVAELIDAAGGESLGNPGAHYSAREISQMDPEVIIASWCGAGDRVPLAKIIDGRQWSSTIAAQTSHVYCISDELLNTPAPTLISGLLAIASAIHPNTFPPVPGLRCITQVPQAHAGHEAENNPIDLG